MVDQATASMHHGSASHLSAALPEAEWEARVELAAAHRLLAHFGQTDLAHNHICVRVPDEPDAMLIKPSEAFFEEVTASNLVKYDFEGKPRQAGAAPLRGGGLIIHAGLMQARPDIQATIHTHTPAIIGVASQKQGLMMINQHAVHFADRIAYHDFGGFEFDMQQREPLIRSLGNKIIALLRNHGSLVCGSSLGEAFVAHHQLEIACQAQIAAMAGGAEYGLIDDKVVSNAKRQMAENHNRHSNGGKDWAGLRRLADRLFPDHKS